MSRRSELLSEAVLKKIKKSAAGDLKQMVVDAMSEARKYKKALKEDQKVNALKEDLKDLEGAYKDQVKACEMIADMALTRIEFLDEQKVGESVTL